MYSRSLKRDGGTVEAALAVLTGYVELDATGAVVAANSRQKGFAVTKIAGNGNYRLTLDNGDTARAVVAIGLTQVWNGASGNITNVVQKGLNTGWVTPAPVSTVDFSTMTGANTSADTTATMGINIELTLKIGSADL
jgi:hypothetical protein